MVVWGWISIGFFRLCNVYVPNIMFLLEPPIASLPWFNTYFIGILAIVVFFITTALYEQIAVKKEERWYNKINKIGGK